MEGSGRTLRRYTNLAGVMRVLQTKKLTLVNPDRWDDGNDRHFIDAYKRGKNLSTLVAICLAQDVDTYGHWKVFSPFSDGVCIVFWTAQLLAAFEGQPGITKEAVRYKRVDALPTFNPTVEQLPFIKRLPYKPEGEFRILYESHAETVGAKDFDLPSDCIKEIVLSPWMHWSLIDSVRTTLRDIKGWPDIPTFQSTLIENRDWKAVADRVVPPKDGG